MQNDISEEEIGILNTNNWTEGVNIIIKYWNRTYGGITISSSEDDHILEDRKSVV